MFDIGTRLSCVLSLAALAGAVEWKGPKATPVNQFAMGLGFSPKPTEPPRIRGRMAGHELFARAGSTDVLCGYVSGVSSDPVTCPDFRRTCFFNRSVKAVGCCSNAADPPASCAQYTSCIDSAAFSCTTCSVDPLIITCANSASPYCQTYQWTSGYSNLGCGASSFSRYVELTYSGQSLSFDSTSSTRIFIPSETFGASSVPASGATAAIASSSAGTATNNKSSSNVGAIAGGVVGGLAVLVALALGIFFLMRRKNKPSAAAPAAGVAAFKPGPTAPPMQQQYASYDPNVPQSPLNPAPQYGAHQPAYYDPSGGAAPLPVKAEYSQNVAPVHGNQPAYQQTAQGMYEMPYNPAVSPAPQAQYPPQQQFQRPQDPIYEAPSDPRSH